MDKLNDYIAFLEMTRSDAQLLVWLLELRRHRLDNWKQRAEAAEAQLAGLELVATLSLKDSQHEWDRICYVPDGEHDLYIIKGVEND